MSLGKKILVGLFGFAFIGGGIAHFLNLDFYLLLTRYTIPPGNLELEKQLIYISGVTELIAGLLFIIPKTRHIGATFIMLHLIAFVPTHVTMCFKHIPTPNPNFDAWYVAWPRLLLQFVLIYWIAQFKMKK